ncbi:MAG TPA: tRNA (adenosine(37)-N6)-threonylcarbamoyltransferase complex dimerization subunit type 1 TsaB [Longimicrobiaceae bacterium]
MIRRPILALDSSTAVGSVAVGGEEGVYAEVIQSVAGSHSASLLPAVEQVMRSAGLRPRDLAAVVVGEGPGSFTGLRIAGATAKGMLRGLDIPLYAYSGLLATAASAWSHEGPVWALFDARRRDVFAACYRFAQGVQVLMPPEAISLDLLLERARGGDGAVPLFVGEGASLHREELERETGGRVGPAHLAQPRAAALLWLAVTVPEMGRVEDPARWEPEYLRASGAERIAAARAERGG